MNNLAVAQRLLVAALPCPEIFGGYPWRHSSTLLKNSAYPDVSGTQNHYSFSCLIAAPWRIKSLSMVFPSK
jgi:hypothetical protein